MSEFPNGVAEQARTLCQHIQTLQKRAPRLVIAIAGAPGSGKSTLAEAVTTQLRSLGRSAVLMPMDGFHLDNRILEPSGWLPRKGAPETFDFGGFHSALTRIRAGETVAIPVFDRNREIAISGAEVISKETDCVVVEGNYLCLDEDPWRGLADLWDLTAYLDVPVTELERRLINRWRSFGYSPDKARDKATRNDIPNARRVAEHVHRVDVVLDWHTSGGA